MGPKGAEIQNQIYVQPTGQAKMQQLYRRLVKQFFTGSQSVSKEFILCPDEIYEVKSFCFVFCWLLIKRKPSGI